MTTLNNLQQQSYGIAQQLARFLRKSKRIYNNVIPFRNEVEAFLCHLDSISAQASIKARKGKAITAEKRDLKKELARETAGICTLATAYALITDNKILLSHVNYSYTDIYTTKDYFLNLGITCLTNAITPYLDKPGFEGYGITAATLASVTEKAKQFTQIIGRGKWINCKSDYASRNITDTLKKIKASIKQLSRLLILFKETHPSFVQHFQQSLIIMQKEKARNAIEGIITGNASGQPLQNATITIEGSTRTAATNVSGFYHLSGIKVGMQKIMITADGYAPLTMNVKINRGKTTLQNIHLQAKSFSMPASEVA